MSDILQDIKYLKVNHKVLTLSTLAIGLDSVIHFHRYGKLL